MRKLLHYEIVPADNERWMVFVHGAGGSTRTWKYQIEAMKGLANLLILDLRDHGDSKAMQPEYKDYTFDLLVDDVLQLLDHLEIRKAFFVSLSMGSMIVQKLALVRPKLIQGAIVSGGIYHANLRIIFMAKAARLLSRLMPFRSLYWLFSWFIMPRKNHQFSRRIFVEQSKKLTHKECNKWMGLYAEFRNVVGEFYHKQLQFPLLAVMGSQDYVFLDGAKRYVSGQKLAQLHVLPNCGHICNIEQAVEFNRIATHYYHQSFMNSN